jgi:PAS domain S-box-containing protein
LQSAATELEYRVWSERDNKYFWLKDIRNHDTSDESVIFGALTNITARKEAEAQQQRLQRELAGQKQILSLTLDALVDGVITIDQNGVILSCNPAIYRMFGYQTHELLNKNIQMLMPQAVGEQHQAHVQRYLHSGESHVIGRGRDVQGLRKDGVEFPLHISVTELPAEHTEQRVFVGCMHDLTETRKQQQQLLQASKLSALGTLTSGIAHDFNNILGIMRGYAEMLGGQQDQQVRHYSQNIIKAADRGSSLTRSLLDFSSNRARELQQGDMNAIVEDLRQLLLEACGKHVELVLKLAPEPLPVEKGGLENALLNMAINARHAMKDGGVLTISTQRCQRSESELKSMDLQGTDYLEIRVRDTGSGMTDEVRQRLFEPFFTTKGTEGNGLGLAQVFGFIRRAQGNIEVKSELGKGTEFSMLLPLSHKSVVTPRRTPTTNEAFRPAMSAPLSSASADDAPAILVVDDEPELLDVHVTMLQAAGFVVYSAGSAAAALEVLQQYRIDVLVSDIVMPEMDGLSLAKQALATYPSLKVQMVSGFANVELASDEVTRQLFADRLTKPVTARGLVNRVRLLLC